VISGFSKVLAFANSQVVPLQPGFDYYAGSELTVAEYLAAPPAGRGGVDAGGGFSFLTIS
jgi:hypothetical protein